MAANVTNSQLKKCTIHAEFLQNLKIANVFIGFSDNCDNFRIKKIRFERRQILVDYTKRGKKSDKPIIETEVFELPSEISILPASISGLKPTSFGWLFRIAYERYKDENVVERTFNFIPECSRCGSKLLNDSAEFSSGLFEVEAKDDVITSSSYFCHNHQHNNNNCQESENNSSTTIPLKAVTNAVNVHIHPSALNRRQIEINANQIIACSRCHYSLGVNNENTLQLNKYAVVGGKNQSLANFIKLLSTSNRFIIRSLNHNLSLWIMDSSMLLLTEKKTAAKSVCKCLYKMEEAGSGSETKTKEALYVVEIDHNIFVDLLGKLLQSSQSLPVAWRFIDKFCVAYLDN